MGDHGSTPGGGGQPLSEHVQLYTLSHTSSCQPADVHITVIHARCCPSQFPASTLTVLTVPAAWRARGLITDQMAERQVVAPG